MKCPVCDHKTNYRKPLPFIKHVHEKHGIPEKLVLQVWSEDLVYCEGCGKVVPSTLYCIICKTPIEAKI